MIAGGVHRVAEQSLAAVAVQVGAQLGDAYLAQRGAGGLQLDGQRQPSQPFDDVGSRRGIAGIVPIIPGAALLAIAFGEELGGGGVQHIQAYDRSRATAGVWRAVTNAVISSAASGSSARASGNPTSTLSSSASAGAASRKRACDNSPGLKAGAARDLTSVRDAPRGAGSGERYPPARADQ